MIFNPVIETTTGETKPGVLQPWLTCMGTRGSKQREVSAYQESYGPASKTTKSKRYAVVSASRTPNPFATPDMKHTMAMERKTHLSMWNDRSLQQVESRLHEMISKILDDLESDSTCYDALNQKGWSTEIDLQNACQPFGFDATMVVTLGVDPEITTYPERRWMMQAAFMAAWRA